ncbi:MAG: hypothetical protein VCA36_03850, partial [Opitutales bacterium]
RRALATASMNFSEGEKKAPESHPIIDLEQGRLDNSSLLFWQGPLPQSPSSETITNFVEKGGVVVFLPPENDDDSVFSGCSWSNAENAPSDKEPFKITSWEQREGPLADTSEGMRLPLMEISVKQRRNLQGDARALAFFQDGKPFLSRIALGKGEIYFLSTLPVEEWSDFSDGFTLVPMAQRLLRVGTRRFDPPASLPCGTPGLVPPGSNWKCVDAPGQKNFHSRAGIYLIDGRLVALNRPASEDQSSTLDLAECKALLGEKTLAAIEGVSGGSSDVPAEIWRIFLFLTLAALLIEALLVMPGRDSAETVFGKPQGDGT